MVQWKWFERLLEMELRGETDNLNQSLEVLKDVYRDKGRMHPSDSGGCVGCVWAMIVWVHRGGTEGSHCQGACWSHVSWPLL